MIGLLLVGGAAGLAYAARDHVRTPFDAAFEAASKEYDVPKNLLRAIARVESGMNPSAVGSRNVDGTRDYGLLQVNERTARNMGFDPLKLPTDPTLAIRAGAAVLADMRRSIPRDKFSAFTWAAAYNVGPDLAPIGVGETYAGKVISHWTLYDVGGLFA